MSDKRGDKRYVRGITGVSLAVILFALILSGVLIQWDMISLNTSSFSAEHTIPIPLMIVLVVLVVICGGVWALAKVKILSRAEMVCVVFAMMIAIPLMSQGFWHRFIGITATIPQDPNFFKFQGKLPSKLWPHGPNIIQGAFDKENSSKLTREIFGNVTWEEVEFEPNTKAFMPVLTNQALAEGEVAGEDARIRIKIPMQLADETELFSLLEPFLISLRARVGIAPEYSISARSKYYCRIYLDDETDNFIPIFPSGATGKITFLQKKGFVRVGDSPVEIPRDVKSHIWLEFGLSGAGVVAMTDPQMLSVDALESATSGRKWVLQSEYDNMPPEDRGGLLVKPDNMWSIAGAKYFLSGYIPLAQWAEPVALWTALLLMVLMASLATNVILRRQWMENERYLMPVTRIPMALIGDPEHLLTGEERTTAFTDIWKNGAMWIGLGIGLVWILLRGWNFFDPSIPDLSVNVQLKQWFKSEDFGKMFASQTFQISAIFISLAMFMELSVLFSIFVFYFIFRSLFWVGESTGWSDVTGYPFAKEQQIGGYLMYAGLILVLMRKYLWWVLKSAIKGDRKASEGEIFSYRTAIGVLASCLILSLVWAWWVDISLSGMAVLFGFLVIVSLIAAKIRTECGTPFSAIAPQNVALVLTLFGGIEAFGIEAVLFATIVSFLVGGSPFFMIPGAQMELAELGKRFRIKPRHLLITVLIGIIGGVVFGGWVFLSNSYAIGGSETRNTWLYTPKSRQHAQVVSEIGSLNAKVIAEAKAAKEGEDGVDSSQEDGAGRLKPQTIGYIYGAAGTGVTAGLRQVFAWFPLHPVGFLIAPTIGDRVWGSCLAAWLVRIIVLWLGGASTVRRRLQPFFIGVFLGAIAGHVIIMGISAYLLSQGVEEVFRWKAIP